MGMTGHDRKGSDKGEHARIYAPYLMFIVEASGVPDEIFEAIEDANARRCQLVQDTLDW